MAFISALPSVRRGRVVLTCSASAESDSKDWRAFRAKLVRTQTPSTDAETSFAHRLAVVEPGALLLANPQLFLQSQTYFNRAAILVFAHENSGSAGLLLNRSHEYLTGETPVLKGIERERIRMGGDVGDGCLFGLVEEEGVGMKIVDGVSLIGGEDLMMLKDKARLYYRYCGWGSGQLDSEIQRGVWTVAAVSKDFLFDDDVYQRVWDQLES